MGQHYYPKLQSCVPFTPVTGRRLLVKPGVWEGAVTEAMADTLCQIADQLGVSSLHMTFNTQQEWEQLGKRHGYLQRAGIQVCVGKKTSCGRCGACVEKAAAVPQG